MGKRWGKRLAVSGTSKSASAVGVRFAGKGKRTRDSTSKTVNVSPKPGKKSDPVNPAHYQGDYVMRVIEDFKLDFLSGTIVKYLLRAGNKPGDSDLQDLKKAKWYLDRKIAALSEK